MLISERATSVLNTLGQLGTQVVLDTSQWLLVTLLLYQFINQFINLFINQFINQSVY